MSRRYLCLSCSRINIEDLAKPEGLEHHPTLAHWKRSAKVCRLCHMFLQTALESDTSRPLEGVDLLSKEECLANYSTALQWLDKDSCKNDVEVIFRQIGTTNLVFAANVCVFTEQNDPAAAYGLLWRRELPENTSCIASLNLAKSWIMECLCKHGKATSKETVRLQVGEPDHAARLLQISASHVHVVSALNVKEPYATLSYSWGQKPQWPWGPAQIEMQDLNARATRRLLREHLPRTIRDAVSVVENLGLRYVLVDALCILQGDEHDWLQESAKMASTFAQAYINIAASGSIDNEAGFFNKRSRSQHHHYRACMPVRSVLQGRPSTLYVCRRSDPYMEPDLPGFDLIMENGPDAFRDEVERGALAQRAWVCQERISSPRTIHFGETQLFWQCAHTMYTEDNLGTQNPSLIKRPWRSHFFPSGPKKARVTTSETLKGCLRLT